MDDGKILNLVTLEEKQCDIARVVARHTAQSRYLQFQETEFRIFYRGPKTHIYIYGEKNKKRR